VSTLSIFTALHGMQTRSSDEKAVCPFVRPSVKRLQCDKTEEKSVQMFRPTKDHSDDSSAKKNGW